MDFMEKMNQEIEMQEDKTKRHRDFGKGVFAGFFGAVLIAAGIWGARTFLGGTVSGSFVPDSASKTDVEKKLDTIDALIDNYYLYEDEIDGDKLVEGIYSGYAQALGDPYTEYYDEEESRALLESTSGEFTGIGVAMSQAADGTVTAVNVYKDSPAEKAGMKENDILLKVDGEEIQGEDLNTVVSRIKGEKGTEVDITVLRGAEVVEMTAVRDVIEVQTVEYKMMEEQIGYISVSEFDDVTYEQFLAALNDLEAQNMQGLVVDVRNNPGGNVETVTNMLKLLLPKGTIMSTKDKEGNTEEITCDGTHEFTKPLAVLVNGNSASASEIFSGAIQDYGTGTIVGTTTYGKGIVQQLIGLGDGTYLKLTIAEYYTPSGRSIHGKGVEPDVEVEYEYDENNPEADNQLEKALETVKEQLN